MPDAAGSALKCKVLRSYQSLVVCFLWPGLACRVLISSQSPTGGNGKPKRASKGSLQEARRGASKGSLQETQIGNYLLSNWSRLGLAGRTKDLFQLEAVSRTVTRQQDAL